MLNMMRGFPVKLQWPHDKGSSYGRVKRKFGFFFRGGCERFVGALVLALTLAGAANAADDLPTITIHADKVLQPVSPYMTGACIEDVNHEIYGGLYSQMIFGESFAEPARAIAPKGFEAFSGSWQVNRNGELAAGAGAGPKLVSNHAAIATGEVGVEIRFADKAAGLAGLIVKVDQPGIGADRWIGYEISLDPGRQVMVMGRHRNNWEHIKDVACELPIGKWIKLAARITGQSLDVLVDGKAIFTYGGVKELPAGRVGLRTWQRPAEFRGLWIKSGEQVEKLPFESSDSDWANGVSGMWRGLRRGTAMGKFTIETADVFAGKQSQRLTFESGDGEIGIENRGLNRQGMSFEAGKPYDGYLWVRAEKPADLFVTMESGDGAKVYGETKLAIGAGGWKRYNVAITPNATDHAGRLALKLKSTASIVIGHVFLQPGEWGRFKRLPVRKDIAEGMLAQGITVLRYGGSMVNAQEYRWKKMIGPRERRPSYHGTWYEYSSNGWGIIDFLNLCEAMGVLGVPDFNIDESPADMADFIDYVNGPADSEWGKKRAADGHPAPYGLQHIELGNEEAVDEVYRGKFEPLMESIWKKDPAIIPVIGDFEYRQVINDPYQFKGAPRITSLASHEKILKFAKERQKPVWFDFHIWNQSPGDCQKHLAALASVAGWFDKFAPGADFKICVFEENATNHAIRRALAHAETINGLMRLAHRVPIVCAANGLQVDGQNDNGWDQGLLFMNSWQIWNQPPGIVTRMISDERLTQSVQVESRGSSLDVFARLSADRKLLSLQVVNVEDKEIKSRIEVRGFDGIDVGVNRLSGELNAVNTSDNPTRVAARELRAGKLSGGSVEYIFAPHSVTVLQVK
jgi:alpha-L-arabinofuranosidase